MLHISFAGLALAAKVEETRIETSLIELYVVDVFVASEYSGKIIKNIKMKKTNRKRLRKGIRNIQSKFYCSFSEKEHEILSMARAKLKNKKPKSKWLKLVRKFLKSMVLFFTKMF